MNWPAINTHDIVTFMGAATITATVLIFPDHDALLLKIAGAYSIINAGQAAGDLGKGAKRWMQGGLQPDDTLAKAGPQHAV